MSDNPFFPPLVAFTAEGLAESLNLELAGSGKADTLITGVAPIEQAEPGTLSFLDNVKYAQHLATTQASCIFMAKRFADDLPSGTVGLISNQPYRDFAKAAAMLVPASVHLRGPALSEGISAGAYVDATATVEDNVTLEPGAIIGAHASIGAGTTIAAGAVVGHHCQIGRGSYVGANATLQHAFIGDRVIIHSGVNIGQDGFGFAMGPTGHLKVPQLGRVVVQDDVEIGAGTCIDRGTTRDTIVGEGTKIDNLVQLGHNVHVGRHCIIVAQVAIAGSTVLEDFVAIGGQAAIAGHLRVGMGAQLAACSSVKDNVPPGAKWAGTPAKAARAVFREIAALKRLGEQGFSSKTD